VSVDVSGQRQSSSSQQNNQNKDLRGGISGSYSSGGSVQISGQNESSSNRRTDQSQSFSRGLSGSQNSSASVRVSGQEKNSAVDRQTNRNQNQNGEINGSRSSGLSVDVSGKKQTSSQGNFYGAGSINMSHEEKSSSNSQSQNSSSDLEAQKTFEMELQKLIKKTKQNHPGYVVNISVDKKGSGKAGEVPENILKQTFDLTGEDALNKDLSFKLSGGKKILIGGTNETTETVHVREHASSASKVHQSSSSASQASHQSESSRFNSQAQGSMSQAASESHFVSGMKKVV
ncbi:hypothetical protein PV325_002351, partial [Microctonus aethiopoides]